MSLKSEVYKLLAKNDREGFLTLLARDRRVVGAVNRLLFDTEELMRWRAVTAMGWVAREDPFLLEKVIARLIWTINDDSGSIGWSAPEALGEICVNDPDLVEDFFPIVISKIEKEVFRRGSLWAIARVTPVRPDLVEEAGDLVLDCLNDPDSGARGLACWCLGRMTWVEAEDDLKGLVEDQGRFLLYEGKRLETRIVGDLAQAALEARQAD
ncbi:MAG: HEAT repeat domain-containing protein [Deltaproteobacteria bacterium]|nr:HEAT repeat domain-containing protein [Deltaproteobacteria bacterium]MBW2085096.1 HEAT repeat domain-containing protein [Deltaproteobacteria bacterium]